MSKQIAQQFAHALDANEFTLAGSLLSQDCTYSINDKELIGVKSIIDSYKEADAWCNRTLDAYKYESCVDENGVITFYDHLEHDGVQHTHCCKQKITLNSSGLIEKIEHIELPNEQKNIEIFFERVGISRMN